MCFLHVHDSDLALAIHHGAVAPGPGDDDSGEPVAESPVADVVSGRKPAMPSDGDPEQMELLEDIA